MWGNANIDYAFFGMVTADGHSGKAA